MIDHIPDVKKKVEHTPIPWKVDRTVVRAYNGEVVTITGKSPHSGAIADAEFIVRAVNSHEALLKAVVLAKRELTLIGHGNGVLGMALDEAIAQAEAQP